MGISLAYKHKRACRSHLLDFNVSNEKSRKASLMFKKLIGKSSPHLAHQPDFIKGKSMKSSNGPPAFVTRTSLSSHYIHYSQWYLVHGYLKKGWIQEDLFINWKAVFGDNC